jgi:putative addiction module component (TIGR02574 family)
MRNVMGKPEEIFQAALALSQEAKLALIEQLFASLGHAVQKDIEARWAAEAEDRLRAFERGELRAVPGKEVFAELRARGAQ